MPNYVTNKVSAPSHVVASMLNTEGQIDFDAVVPWTGCRPCPGEGLSCLAEHIAKNLPSYLAFNNLTDEVRRSPLVKNLDEESVVDLILSVQRMAEDRRSTGYLHDMDFARDKWGTKWNAFESLADVPLGVAQFKTAWSMPDAFFLALSKMFPRDRICVQYADEHLGQNCGRVVYSGGKKVFSRSSAFNSDPVDGHASWYSFAHEVQGSVCDLDEDDEACPICIGASQ